MVDTVRLCHKWGLARWAGDAGMAHFYMRLLSREKSWSVVNFKGFDSQVFLVRHIVAQKLSDKNVLSLLALRSLKSMLQTVATCQELDLSHVKGLMETCWQMCTMFCSFPSFLPLFCFCYMTINSGLSCNTLSFCCLLYLDTIGHSQTQSKMSVWNTFLLGKTCTRRSTVGCEEGINTD